MLATYLVNKRHKLCFETDSLDRILKYKAMRLNFYFIPAMVAVMFGLNYFQAQPVYAVYAIALYAGMMARLFKRFYPEKDTGGPILSRLFRKRKTVLVDARTTGEIINN